MGEVSKRPLVIRDLMKLGTLRTTTAMQVKDLTIDELKILIRETVMEALEEFLADPDEGRTLKEELKQDLLKIRKRREAGIQGIPTEEVMHKLGL